MFIRSTMVFRGDYMIYKLIYLFMMGSVLGWFLELIYRRYFSSKKWINPGFLVGPYLPLYGTGLTLMFLLSNYLDNMNINNQMFKDLIIILILGVSMTIIELITGLIFIKGMRIKLWDYSSNFMNYEGIICPLFSFVWLFIAFVYYNLLHQNINQFFDKNDLTSPHILVLGIYLGIFIVDNIYSFNVAAKVSRFAKESRVLVIYDQLKTNIQKELRLLKKKSRFTLPFYSPIELTEHLKSYVNEKIKDNKMTKEIVSKIKSKKTPK